MKGNTLLLLAAAAGGYWWWKKNKAETGAAARVTLADQILADTPTGATAVLDTESLINTSGGRASAGLNTSTVDWDDDDIRDPWGEG